MFEVIAIIFAVIIPIYLVVAVMGLVSLHDDDFALLLQKMEKQGEISKEDLASYLEDRDAFKDHPISFSLGFLVIGFPWAIISGIFKYIWSFIWRK